MEPKLLIKQDNIFNLVPINKIPLMVFDQKKIKVFSDDKEYILTGKTLNQVEELLPSNTFTRVHHRSIINIHRIKSIDFQGLAVHLDNGETVKVSTRKGKDLKESIKSICIDL